MKSATILALTVMSSIALTQAAPSALYQTNPTTFTTDLAYTCEWARGLLQGFEIGFFKIANFQNNPSCLDGNFQNLVIETFTGYNQATFSWVNNTVNIQTMLNQIQQGC